MTSEILRDFVFENPMLEEAGRMSRKHLQTNGTSSRKALLQYAGAACTVLLSMVAVWWYYGVKDDLSPALLVIQLIVITIFVPQSIHAAISGERERATWEALVLTCLTPGQIITGKIVSRIVVAFIIMLLMLAPMIVSHICSPPGIRAQTSVLIYGQAMIAGWALLLASFGLLVSAHCSQIATSASVTFCTLLGVLLFLPVIISVFAFGGPSDLMPFIVQLNPFVILAVLTGIVDSHSRTLLMAAPAAGLYAAITYLIVAGMFLRITAERLRRMDEPKRKSG